MKQKKTLVLLLMSFFVASTSLLANDYNSIDNVEFYGVDFSQCHVIGAKETEPQLKLAFNKINDLFIREASKYNVSKYIMRPIGSIRLEEVRKRNASMQSFLSYSKTIKMMPQEEFEAYIQSFTFKDEEGQALIILCDVLDKFEGVGLYHYVFVDKSDHKILFDVRVSGHSGGFGLRNYWARSLYNSLKNFKFRVY
ncbi:hypothetical protein N9251_01760 [Gammaproteobacteria bacterium]|nr:hypothetical protein [Gammaproteobacteria bacterium]